MQQAAALYALQTIDLQIEDLTRKLRSVETQLADDSELRAARVRQRELEDQLQHAQVDLTESELVLGKVESKAKEVEKKLYGGTVRNPKELQDLQRDFEMVGRQRGAEDDHVLAAMEQVDDLQSALTKARGQVQAVEGKSRDVRERLTAERAALRSQIAELKQKRDEQASRRDASLLQVYEKLRREKRGVAVVKVEQLNCLGCRIAQPASLIQKARAHPELAFCNSCGRILLPER
ncbi:MAG: hypothetical protein HY329_04690 [Chloroflexi bacterium]|nr:hypothetical protein [Chloroflexota bacterium]